MDAFLSLLVGQTYARNSSRPLVTYWLVRHCIYFMSNTRACILRRSIQLPLPNRTFNWNRILSSAGFGIIAAQLYFQVMNVAETSLSDSVSQNHSFELANQNLYRLQVSVTEFLGG